ncbi:hypothetical protein Q1695_016220 [Nippostrongylus brasiliensis]|nr:hypothetical protein Q1695_016220 [Nippostrongylus brasiliensis]
MSFWHLSRIMDRVMDEYMKELAGQRGNAPYWRDADHSVLHVANEAHQIEVEYFQTSDDDKKFAVTLDVSQFKPEELKVNLDGRVLVVEGRQQQKDDKSFMSRSFIRSWCLPEEVDLNGLKTELTNDGKLVIEAPKNPPASGSNRRNIPISHSSGQQESSDRQVDRRSRHSDREDPYHSPSDRGSRRR